ncbi:MAG: DNA gyrase C-terminal beta-propeller domain-containing protein [Dehalococcoidia bacterium]
MTHVILVSSEGQAIRFKIDDPAMPAGKVEAFAGCGSQECLRRRRRIRREDGPDILIISERGFGKRTPIESTRQGRGGHSVRTLNITDRTGVLAACRVVDPRQQLMLVSRDGIVIRTRVDTISRIGRNTQGVAVFNVAEGDQVASIATFWLEADRNPSPDPELAASANGQGGLPLN